MSVYVIIPACNEAKNIGDVIKKVRKHTNNIIVVDDGSRDKTYEIARKNKAVVLRHVVNMGKGAALKTGCDYALKQGAKKIIVLDADGQHDPKEIPVFLKNLNRNEIVFGGRKLNKKMPFVLKFGNLVLHQIAKSLYNIDIKDTQCGYRAFTANAYKKIRSTGASVALITSIVDRRKEVQEYDGAIVMPLLKVNSERHSPEECPMCKEGIELTKVQLG